MTELPRVLRAKKCADIATANGWNERFIEPTQEQIQAQIEAFTVNTYETTVRGAKVELQEAYFEGDFVVAWWGIEGHGDGFLHTQELVSEFKKKAGIK